MGDVVWPDPATWEWAPRWLPVTGGRLHYVRDGAGPPVVLVPRAVAAGDPARDRHADCGRGALAARGAARRVQARATRGAGVIAAAPYTAPTTAP